jgi:3-mercaptopyruvate sulfurtransferase SseA
MNQKGIANTYALQGGTQGWKNAGYPMEGKGGQPLNLQPVPNPPSAPDKSGH